jgi:hypothetical protein
MTTRTFSPWVEPIAADFRRERAAVTEFARAAPPAFWERQSSDEDWTCKDIMSHLAAGTGKQLQTLLRSVTTRTRLDPDLFGHAEEVNGRDVQARRGRSIEAIIDEYEADTEEILDLLSQINEEDKDRRQKDFESSFSEALAIFPPHDREHLEQLRAALKEQA